MSLLTVPAQALRPHGHCFFRFPWCLHAILSLALPCCFSALSPPPAAAAGDVPYSFSSPFASDHPFPLPLPLPKRLENTRYKPNHTSHANLQPGSQAYVAYHMLKRQWFASPSRRSGTTSAPPPSHQPSSWRRNKGSSPGHYLGLDPSSQHSCHPVVIAGKLLVGEDPKLITARRRQGHGRWQDFFSYCFGKKGALFGSCECRGGEGLLGTHFSSQRQRQNKSEDPAILQAQPLQVASAKDRHVPKATTAEARDTKLRRHLEGLSSYVTMKA